MSYLNREARRETIMRAAMDVALQEGLTAMTVRHIAAQAGVATGQVHHHFASAGELKSEAFIRLIREMMDIQALGPQASWQERLFSLLGSEDGRLEPYIRLWRQAQLLADGDAELRRAYTLTMTLWHDEVVSTIEGGRRAGEFMPRDSIKNIAWRLIALVCGLDGIYLLGLTDIDDAAFRQHIEYIIQRELLT